MYIRESMSLSVCTLIWRAKNFQDRVCCDKLSTHVHDAYLYYTKQSTWINNAHSTRKFLIDFEA